VSAYDPESNLRLLRFAGNVEIDWLIERAPRDPTHQYLPHCLTLVDQRRARFRGGPSEISAFGAMMGKLVSPDFEHRYAWLVDRMETVGIDLAFLSGMGASRRIRWFTEEADAVAYLGVTPADLDRVASKLAPVEPNV
jgi:hypothetical protein